MLLAMAAISSRADAVLFPAVRKCGRSMLTTAKPPLTLKTTPSNANRNMVSSNLAGQAIDTLSRKPG
jgi:hypothetical protein